MPLFTSFLANVHSLLSLPLRCLERNIFTHLVPWLSLGEKRWVLSCHAKCSLCFWFGISLSLSCGSWLDHANSKEKNTCDHHWNSHKPLRSAREVYLIGMVVSPPVTPGIHQRIQSTCQGMIFFSHCLSSKSKAPHPQEIWKNHWPGFKWSLCLYLLQHCRVLGNILKKRLWGLPESWPLGTVIFEAEIMWACLGGSERVRKDHVSQSLSEGKRRVHPQPGKAVLDRFSNLGTELPVTLDFWFSVELFFYLYDFSWTFFISIWFWQGR